MVVQSNNCCDCGQILSSWKSKRCWLCWCAYSATKRTRLCPQCGSKKCPESKICRQCFKTAKPKPMLFKCGHEKLTPTRTRCYLCRPRRERRCVQCGRLRDKTSSIGMCMPCRNPPVWKILSQAICEQRKEEKESLKLAHWCKRRNKRKPCVDCGLVKVGLRSERCMMCCVKYAQLKRACFRPDLLELIKLRKQLERELSCQKV